MVQTAESTTRGGGLLQRLSDEMAGVVAGAGRSIVRVNARRRLPATGIVWAADEAGSTIVTSNHVVERDEDITITTADGRQLPATLVGRDGGSDIAVLAVAGERLEVATTDGGDPRAGGLVLALGRAGELAATVGVVSAVVGPWGGRHGRRFERLISSDAPMFPGFSGGPLVDASGTVLGVLSSHLGRGHTLAVPAEDVSRVVAALKAHGRVRRGYLGVGAQPVALPAVLKQAAGLSQEYGLLLASVEESGPAGQAGLAIGDIIVAIGGQPVQGLDDLRAALGGEAVGVAKPVRILRGGQAREISVTIGEQAA